MSPKHHELMYGIQSQSQELGLCHSKLLWIQVINNWLQNILLSEESSMIALQLCLCICTGRLSPLSNLGFSACLVIAVVKHHEPSQRAQELSHVRLSVFRRGIRSTLSYPHPPPPPQAYSVLHVRHLWFLRQSLLERLEGPLPGCHNKGMRMGRWTSTLEI